MPTTTYPRKQQIKDQLEYLKATGTLTSWYAYNPGDSGTRWSLGAPGFDLSLSTREVEVWLSGVSVMRRKNDAKPVVAYRVTTPQEGVPDSVNIFPPSSSIGLEEGYLDFLRENNSTVEALVVKGNS